MKLLKLIACVYFGLSSLSSNAQYNPSIYADLYSGSNLYNGIQNLYFSATLGNKLLFNRKNDTNFDLLVTSGNPTDVQVLLTTDQYLNLFTFNNKVYFGTKDIVNGAELWETDGTISGTQRVAILGGNMFTPTYFKEIGGKMYFHSGNTNSPNARQLYVLEAGSSNPSILGQNLYDPVSHTAFDGGVVFAASTSPIDPYLKRELYKTDGTEAGTVLIKDIKPGVDGSNPDNFFVFNNIVYFTADDGTFGREIWMSDGSETGTIILKDINAGAGLSTYSFQPGVLDNKFYFSADNGINGAEVWFSDGSTNGTALFLDINTSGNGNPAGFVEMNGNLLFLVDDGTHGKELWSTDGTSSNTIMIKDIASGQETASYALFQRNKLCDNQLFFDAGTSTNIEPWVTDGTATGTYQIGDLHPSGSSVDYETYYLSFNNQIFFAVYTETGRELVVMDVACQLSEIEEKNLFIHHFFPNPFSSSFVVKSEGKAAISLVSLEGKVVFNSDFVDSLEINTNDLEAGTYLLSIHTNKGILTEKVIKY